MSQMDAGIRFAPQGKLLLGATEKVVTIPLGCLAPQYASHLSAKCDDHLWGRNLQFQLQPVQVVLGQCQVFELEAVHWRKSGGSQSLVFLDMSLLNLSLE